jgi:hypothetical protein
LGSWWLATPVHSALISPLSVDSSSDAGDHFSALNLVDGSGLLIDLGANDNLDAIDVWQYNRRRRTSAGMQELTLSYSSDRTNFVSLGSSGCHPA